MKIKIQQFLCANHSWSVVGWNLARSFIKAGHEVCLYPTDFDLNKKNHLPIDLQPYVKSMMYNDFDMQVSYTAPINWGKYLNNGSNKFAIWNYEYRGTNLLPGFAKYYKYADKILPSSDFSKEVFLDMAVPESYLNVIPHGINLEDFKNKKKYELKTKKRYKILLNIAQPHKRKAIHLALKTFGEAFNKHDDVCLVAKISIANKTNHQFNVDFYKLYKQFCNDYKNHAEVEIITEYIYDIVELYNACDINFSATHAEAWWLPGIEALAAGIINVTPNYGGQLHFCNDKNSLLISGKTQRAPKTHQYWHASPYAYHFQIDINDAVEKLRLAYENYSELKTKMQSEMAKTAEKFTWDNATKQIIDHVK